MISAISRTVGRFNHTTKSKKHYKTQGNSRQISYDPSKQYIKSNHIKNKLVLQT